MKKSVEEMTHEDWVNVKKVVRDLAETKEFSAAVFSVHSNKTVNDHIDHLIGITKQSKGLSATTIIKARDLASSEDLKIKQTIALIEKRAIRLSKGDVIVSGLMRLLLSVHNGEPTVEEASLVLAQRRGLERDGVEIIVPGHFALVKKRKRIINN